MSLGKGKLNTIEALIFKALIDPYISRDEFVSVKTVLREYYKIKKSWNFCVINYIKMVDVGRKAYERNGIEAIVDNDRILRLNEKYKEERLDHNLRKIATKYNLNHI